MYWTTDDDLRFELKADGQVWRLSVPEAAAEQGYDLALNGKSLWLTDGREVFWNCGPFWTEPNHAEVMMALGLHEADVAEYRRWHAGGLLHATRTELGGGMTPAPSLIGQSSGAWNTSTVVLR
jgi:hypothetical protein